MAIIRNLRAGEDHRSSAPATHAVEDENGENLALGHFEVWVPVWQEGTRCSDMTFVVDKVIKKEATTGLEALRGTI